MKLQLQGKTNIFLEIVEQFKKYIVLNIFKHGDKLPSCRNLASELGINPNTVNKAYLELEKQGYIKNLPKKGVYVCYGEEVEENDEELIKVVKELYNSDVKKEKLLEIIDLVYKEANDDWN